MIEIADLVRRFGRGARTTEALRGVSLSIRAGATCAFVGPNGAGKTTLFAMLLGFLHPDGGRIGIEGREPRAWVRAHGAAWLPERFAPPGPWLVREMLIAFARLDANGRDAIRRASHAIDTFGLGACAERRMATLSRGLLQRVGLAQALCTPHRLVVLDEPTDGLDLEGRTAFRESLRRLSAAGTTVLLASHDLAEVERVADRVVLLANGRVSDAAFTAPPARSRYVLQAIAPEPLIREAFPGAELAGSADTSPSEAARYDITVDDLAALNAGLARIIGAGGLVLGVWHDGRLETRVARALRTGEPGAGPRTGPASEG